MSKIGRGYGSEWHLLRHLGRHRAALNAAVLGKTGGEAVRWLDFPPGPDGEGPDAEWQGLDFLPPDSPAREAWREFWPQTGNAPNWDAVGQLTVADACEWLLVEAKAHTEELVTSCGAKQRGGLPQIRRALEETREAFGADSSADWLLPYYQHANRLAALYFLT